MSHPSLDSPPDDAVRLRRFAYVLLIALAGGLGASSIWRVEPLLSANDRSRWATVRALTELDAWHIDDVIVDKRRNWTTIDKVRHEERFYSSKPPLLALLVSWATRAVTATTDYFDGEAENERDASKHDGWTLGNETEETTRAVLTLVNLVPWLIALALIAAMVERYAQRDFTRLFVVAAAAMGTLLSTFLVTLNNHVVGAVSLVFALYPAMRIVIDGERKPWLFAAAGFFAAFTCTNELPAALFGLAIFGLLAWKAPKQTLLFFGPAAVVPLAAFFAVNYEVTGGIKPFYAYYGTEKYEYVYRGEPSYWMNPGGLDANEEPPWLYFLHCTVGHHGVFSLTPIFLLSVVGWGGIRQWKDRRLSPFLWMGLGLTIAILGFYLSRTQNYNYGGNTAGLRWTFWLIPFWLIAMIPAFDRFASRGWFRGFAAALLAVSVFSATYSLQNPWTSPWLYRLMQRWELIDYSTPSPESPYKTRITTWFARLPGGKDGDDAERGNVNGAKADAREWVRFEGADSQGGVVGLELRDGGPVDSENDGETLRNIAVRWLRNGEPVRNATFTVDSRAFHAGKDPAAFLRNAEGTSREEAVAFLRGLPGPRPYSVGKPAYVETPLQPDRMKTWRTASRVFHTPPGGSKRRRIYRTDVWLSDEIPFGVLQVLHTTYDAETGAVVSLQQLTAVAAGRIRPE